MSAEETAVEVPNVTVIPADEPLSTAVVPPPEDQKTEDVAETKEEEVAAEETTDDGQERDDKGRFKNKVQERINELTRKAGESEREAAYWRGVAEAAKPKTAAEPAIDPSKPKADGYESYDAYLEALTDWKIEQRDQQRSAKQQAEAQATTWAQRAAAAKEAMPDFDDVMQSSSAPMSKAMAEAIKDSEHGPALAYHLAKNPSEAVRLSLLSPLGAAREIGKIEATLSTPKATAPAPRKVTSAPTPPTTIGAGRSTDGDPGKMSQADYMVWRQTQLKEMR